jgi:hypothetical protein
MPAHDSTGDDRDRRRSIDPRATVDGELPNGRTCTP